MDGEDSQVSPPMIVCGEFVVTLQFFSSFIFRLVTDRNRLATSSFPSYKKREVNIKYGDSQGVSFRRIFINKVSSNS